MHDQVFQEQYKRLNREQKKAVDIIEGPVMVIAGPGTGKTQILILRIANILLKTQVNPENILTLTFTESAVAEIRKRLVNLIGNAGYRVEINTFHGFCNDVIKRFPDYFQELIAATSITELEQIQILEKILTDNDFSLLKPLGDLLYYVRPLLSTINDLKKENISPEDFAKGVIKWEEDFKKKDDLYHAKGAHKGKMKGMYVTMQRNIQKNKEVAKVYQLYEELLHKKKQYDYNDMLLTVITTMQKNAEFLLQLQEQFHYILVDEHQDTNTAQNTLLELLASFHPNPNIFVVGDEKQAIFRFQGASLENFLYFQKLYTQAILITLTENYRSSQTILDSAIGMMAQNNTLPEPLQRGIKLQAKAGHENKKIHIAKLQTFESEFAYIAHDIQQKIIHGIQPTTIAALVRKNKDIVPLTQYCDLYEVPYVIEADQDILADTIIQQLILLLRTIQNLGSDAELIGVLHSMFFDIEPMDIYRLVAYANQEKISIWSLLDETDQLEEVHLKNKKSLQTITQKFQTWKKLCYEMPLDQLIKCVLEQSGLLSFLLKKKQGLIHLENIKRFLQEVYIQVAKNPQFDLEKLLIFVDTLAEHHMRITHVPTIAKNGIHIMTAHKAKGLEFDYVYIMQVYEGHWGSGRKIAGSITIPWEYLKTTLTLPTEEDVYEDERRLFFVALTRAKKEIIVSYATHSIDGKEQIPSAFLSEIDDVFLEEIPTQQFEEAFLAHPTISLSSTQSESKNKKQENYRENKNFFADLFQKKGLSATALANYLTCPWRYFFCNLLEVPGVPTEKETYGKAIHQSLAEFFQKQQELQSKQLLLTTFTKIIEQTETMTLVKKRLQEEGEKALSGFFDTIIPQIQQPALSEIAIRGILLDDIPLNGRIDLLEKQTESNYIVHDFKSTKPISRNAIAGIVGDRNYKRQLLFYKLLLDSYKNNQYKTTTGVIDFVQPDEKGNYKSETFTLAQKEVNELKTLIKQVTEEIRNLDFWEKLCDDKACEYCTMRSYLN